MGRDAAPPGGWTGHIRVTPLRADDVLRAGGTERFRPTGAGWRTEANDSGPFEILRAAVSRRRRGPLACVHGRRKNTRSGRDAASRSCSTFAPSGALDARGVGERGDVGCVTVPPAKNMLDVGLLYRQHSSRESSGWTTIAPDDRRFLMIKL